MRITISRILLVMFLLGMIYAHRLGGGAELIVPALLAFLLLSGFASGNQLVWLFVILLASITTSVFSVWQHPEAMREYAKNIISFSAALFTGYYAFITVTSMTRSEVSSTCLTMTLLILVLATVEILVPDAQAFSDQMSARFYAQEDKLARNLEKDSLLHWGARPRLGVQEPSWVAYCLGLCVTGWNLTRQQKAGGTLQLLALFLASLVVVRSLTFVLVFGACNILYVYQALSRFRNGGILVLTALVGLGGITAFVLQNRVIPIMRGEDGSFNERIRLPYEFTKEALITTNGMGIGLVGSPAEAGNSALEFLLPAVVTALQKSRTAYLLYYYNKEGLSISISHSAFLTYWYVNGIYCGPLLLGLWAGLIKRIDRRLVMMFFATFLLLGFAGWGYDSIRLWTTLFMTLGFSVHYLYSNEPAVAAVSRAI